MHTPDFNVTGEGSWTTVYLLTPNTPAAREWVADNLPFERTTLGASIAVEHRYIAPIVEGIMNDGLTVA